MCSAWVWPIAVIAHATPDRPTAGMAAGLGRPVWTIEGPTNVLSGLVQLRAMPATANKVNFALSAVDPARYLGA